MRNLCELDAFYDQIHSFFLRDQPKNNLFDFWRDARDLANIGVPPNDWIVDPAGEELVAAEDAQGAGTEGSMGGVEGKLPFGIFRAGRVVAAGAREHAGDVLVGFDGGDEEAFEVWWCHGR